MQKINVIISIVLISIMCVMFTACDYSKKYTSKEINQLYTEIVSDEEIKSIFNAENKKLQIIWSDKIEQGFALNSAELDNIENVFLPCLEISFDIFNQLNLKITDKWQKEDTTKIYEALKETKKDLYNFVSHKKSLETALATSENISKLDSIQKNYYDNLIYTMINLNNKVISLSEKIVNAYISNECPNFYLEENSIEYTNKDLIALTNILRLDLVRIAYNYDIKTSYSAYEARTFLFGFDISNVMKSSNSLYLSKSATIFNDSAVLNENLKNNMNELRLKQKQINNNIAIYEKALQSYNLFDIYKNRSELNDYFSSLPISKQTDYQIVQDFNNYYYSFIASSFQALLNSI